jgi:hypothetical protein
MPDEPARGSEPEDAGCVDDSEAAATADATAQDDDEPAYDEIEMGEAGS